MGNINAKTANFLKTKSVHEDKKKLEDRRRRKNIMWGGGDGVMFLDESIDP
jgi:hypothetical protein